MMNINQNAIVWSIVIVIIAVGMTFYYSSIPQNFVPMDVHSIVGDVFFTLQGQGI
jgi:uncharacterized membrane protein (DUF373 family)